MNQRVPVWIFFVLFTVSGFAGLIYESIWTQYLKLFLGHAAYAQTLVLGIFMGGMSLGAWLTGRYAARIKYALLGYAAVEFAIGVLALSFHGVFQGATAWAYDALIPALAASGLVNAGKWGLATLLILPASILLGATFPLMSTAIIRIYQDREARALPMLYFTNSFGASMGVLASGFVLVESFGLPGTIFTAGMMNIGLALVVWALSKLVPEPAAPEWTTETAGPTAAVVKPHWKWVIYAAAMGTGIASFMFEIAWIRMLTLAIGASTHSFEVMLSAFIFGIAIGGLVLTVILPRIRNDGMFLGMVLVAKCLLALLAVAIYPALLDLVKWLYEGLSKTEIGYSLFLTASYVVSGMMMIPTAICAGMTLPLATRILLRRGAGESSIGRIYAINTLGSIIGAFAATHIGFELLGVKWITGVGALLELGVALAIFSAFAGNETRRRQLRWGLALLLVFPSYAAFAHLDQLKMSSGVFRYGRYLTPAETKVAYYQDGKTATISVIRTGTNISIQTNGKTDANLQFDQSRPPSADEYTMVMLGSLPFIFKPDAQEVANIGFGSGLTSHVVLGNPGVKRLDTIEIEPAVIDGAKLFMPLNERAYKDPRSNIHIEDAKTFFAVNGKRYDVIISEPSNPWISGVATLFSEEFYAHTKRYLKPDGMLVQWLHVYETSPYIVGSILKAMSLHYSDYVIYAANSGDIIVLAVPNGAVPKPALDPLQVAGWTQTYERLGFHSAKELNLVRVGSRSSMHPVIAALPGASNSDFYPVVDLSAPRERFRKSTAGDIVELPSSFVSMIALLDDPPLPSLSEYTARTLARSGKPEWNERMTSAIQAAHMVRALGPQGAESFARLSPVGARRVSLIRLGMSTCDAQIAPAWLDAVEDVFRIAVLNLDRRDLVTLGGIVGKAACAQRLTPDLKDRLAVFVALSSRDPLAIEKSTAALIDPVRAKDLPEADFATVVFANLAAKIAQGKFVEAQQVLDQHRSRLVRPGLPLSSQLILAHLQQAKVRK